MYNPLPTWLTIKESGIHGLGLFATCDIGEETDLGIAHIELPNFPQNHCRTPLGGFYNHSKDPNCKLVTGTELFSLDPDIKSSVLFLTVKRLFTAKYIMKDEELTCEYTIYEIDKNKDTS